MITSNNLKQSIKSLSYTKNIHGLNLFFFLLSVASPQPPNLGVTSHMILIGNKVFADVINPLR